MSGLVGKNRDQKKTAKSSIWRAAAALPVVACALAIQPAQAQSANGQASANINQSLTVVKNADLEFGTFIAGTTQSDFRLNPNNGNLNQRNGDAVAIGGTPGPASFTASGDPLLRVRITVSQNQISIVRDGGTETMRVNRFRFDGGRNRFLNAAGEVTYQVGGQLRIGANQAPGTYRGAFDVTIDYF